MRMQKYDFNHKHTRFKADIFTYSDYSLAVSSEEYPMYTTGITIKGTYAEDFKARSQMIKKLRYSDLIVVINY